MTSPTGKSSVRVLPETHKELHDLAARIGAKSADEAIRHLLGMSAVRVSVSDVQRERWIAAASGAGVSLSEFVRMRVEAAVQYGGDPAGLQLIYEHLRSFAAAMGYRYTPRPHRSTDGPQS